MIYFEFLFDPVFKYFFLICNLIAIICWLRTLITNNFSQIDRIWSIMPVVSAWCFLFTAVYFNPNKLKKSEQQNITILKSDISSLSRLIIITILITIWGLRLTYNYWRKGGYKPNEEDYRWFHVKKMFNYPEKKVIFHLFNFGFIAFIQSWLLMGLAMPVWFIQINKSNSATKEQEPLNIFDIILTLVFLGFYAIEVIADQQQFTFQTKKHRWLKEGNNSIKQKYSEEELNDFKLGFLTRGLFRYSRHPNFFGELGMWYTIYLFTITSQYSSLVGDFQYEKLINACILAPLVLNLIFHGSTNLTEKITLSKYPKYKEFQSQVNRIVPFFSNIKLSSK